ncbi:37S ribosomal protein S10, mitochondrial [Golovinomyces cichoracearum]|uniref:Small ribosomal subunit protein uS10m n=1 Tax=Golovinomyces cichoracearum TaxID=62708 RepID=A0A420J135_9PEZI|nr:37S ribosomal protein S10, mitochondrial [Golovinomyces cichoracearum]
MNSMSVSSLMAVSLLLRASWSRAGIRLGSNSILTRTDLYRFRSLDTGAGSRARSSRRYAHGISTDKAPGDKEKDDSLDLSNSDSSALPSWLDASFEDMNIAQSDQTQSSSDQFGITSRTDFEANEKNTLNDPKNSDEINEITNSDPSTTKSQIDWEADQNVVPEGREIDELDDLENFDDNQEPRPPRAVQAAYLRPLRRQPTHNIPVCDLQLRSYSARNLEFMADFALRAAYFLNLPANGPVPLPQIVERWTVPKAHFIHKKIQENFERKTLRRLIQIKDGDSEVVRLWLGFLRKHAYYGVGMKANVWEFAGVDVAKGMDAALEQNRPEIEPLLAQYAFQNGTDCGEKLIEVANRENRWQASGGSAPMINTPDWRKPLN